MKEDNIQIDNVLNELKDLFTNDLLGVYLYGSYVESGLKTNSDIDFLVILNRDMTYQEKEQLISKIMPISKSIGADSNLRYIELTVLNYNDNVPWTYPPTEDFVYGEWLREDYLNNIIPTKKTNSDLAILLYQARSNSISLYGDKNIKNLVPEIPLNDLQKAIEDASRVLIGDYEGDETNVILTFCRMILTYITGEVYSKETAGQIVMESLSDEEAKLVQMAVNDYKTGEYIDWHLYPVETLIQVLQNRIGHE